MNDRDRPRVIEDLPKMTASSVPPAIRRQGARAWSGEEPYFCMPVEGRGDGIPVHGLAVCVYEESGAVYRLACNGEWETKNDAPYGPVEAAMSGPSGQFYISRVAWRMMKIEGPLRRLDGAATHHPGEGSEVRDQEHHGEQTGRERSDGIGSPTREDADQDRILSGYSGGKLAASPGQIAAR